jgi:hypothetical protein
VHQIIVVDQIGVLLYDGLLLKKLIFLYKKKSYFRDYNEEEPWIIAFKTQAVEMEKLSFSKQ